MLCVVRTRGGKIKIKKSFISAHWIFLWISPQNSTLQRLLFHRNNQLDWSNKLTETTDLLDVSLSSETDARPPVKTFVILMPQLQTTDIQSSLPADSLNWRFIGDESWLWRTGLKHEFNQLTPGKGTWCLLNINLMTEANRRYMWRFIFWYNCCRVTNR